jgi:hypothetical protein
MKYIEQKAYNITIEKLIDHCDDLVKSISKNKELQCMAAVRTKNQLSSRFTLPGSP